jgi:hypothetical protein
MIKTKPKRYITGAAAIAAELGCSPVTARRMIRSGKLKAFRTGTQDNSSPWRVWLAEIERIRSAGRQMEPAE